MSLRKLRQKIKKKKPWAYAYLGERYEVGLGVKKSLNKAIDYYKKGVKLGDPECMTALGNMYTAGKGVDQDDKLAFKHYQKAAFKGYAGAQFNVGVYYANGMYVEQSAIKAREWAKRAAAQGFEAAIEHLKRLDEFEKEPEEKKTATKQTDEKKEEEKENQPQIMQEEKIKSEIPSASTQPRSKNIIGNKKIETKDTNDLEIVPWIDDAPKNAMKMTLNKLRQKVKKKRDGRCVRWPDVIVTEKVLGCHWRRLLITTKKEQSLDTQNA